MLYFQPEGIGFKMWVRQVTEVLVISAEREVCICLPDLYNYKCSQCSKLACIPCFRAAVAVAQCILVVVGFLPFEQKGISLPLILLVISKIIFLLHRQSNVILKRNHMDMHLVFSLLSLPHAPPPISPSFGPLHA